jgi:hypothetical protein
MLDTDCALATGAQLNQSDDYKLEVVSVRVMTDEESSRIAGPDFIGADVLVRLRLSATGRDLFFYGFEHIKKPIGYSIKWEGDEKVWVYPIAGKNSHRTSPGIEALRKLVPTGWFKLEKGKTVEWEVLDGTGSAEEKHGTSAFIKFLPAEKPVEIFTDSYRVPSRPAVKP